MPKKTRALPPPKTATPIIPEGYETFLRGLKQRIQQAQIRAALSVNRELVLLYWQTGRDILQRKKEQGWGAKVVDQLAADLHKSFPEMQGFSARNLKYMRAFAEAWPDVAIVQQLVAQIPWGHFLYYCHPHPSSVPHRFRKRAGTLKMEDETAAMKEINTIEPPRHAPPPRAQRPSAKGAVITHVTQR